MRIEAGVGDLMQRTGDGQAQVEYSVAGRSRGQVTLCSVYTMHKEMRSAGFLVQPQNQGRRFLPVWPQNQWLQFLWFGLKTTRSGFPVWASKPAARFGDLAYKITTVVYWFGPQNQVGYGLSVVP
jgi:hypothetical protein